MLRRLHSYVDIMRTILLTFVLIGRTVIGQNDLDPVGPGVCNHIISRLDTVVTSVMQSRIVPYNGECSWQRHIAGCLVYKVTFQPIYKTTTKLNHITDYKCCHGWSRVGQKCEKAPTTVPEPPQGPNQPALDVPRYPFKPGLGGRGQRQNPGIGQRGFGPGAFVPRPGFGPAKPTGRPGFGRGQGSGPQFDQRPGFGAGTNQNPSGGFGPRTETGFGGGGPSVGTEPRYGVPGTQNPDYPVGPQFTQRPQFPQRPQRPQGPQYGGPPLTPLTPGYGSHFGGNGGRGQSNNAGTGNGVKPDVVPGTFPDQANGQGPAEGDKNGNGHLNKENSGGGSIVTIMGALLGVFAIFGIGAVLMMYLSRRRDSSGRRSVRLRRSSLRDAAGRDSEAHKSWKFSIYQFRLQ